MATASPFFQSKSITNNGQLRVLIVGACIGGLTAAIGLRAEGHNVTMFERSALAQETGAAMHLAPNCHGLLQRFDIFPETFGANKTNGIVEFDHEGNLRMSKDLRQDNSKWPHVRNPTWVLCHRVHLHEALKESATSQARQGTPVILATSSPVVDVDVASTTVTLADGSWFSGDLILGADGVSSVTRRAVIGNTIKPFGSGKAAFRFLIPKQKIMDHPELKRLVQNDSFMVFWYGKDRRIVMYPCVDNTVMNLVAMHPCELSQSQGEGFDHRGSKQNLPDVYADFCPNVQALLNMVDENSLKLWTLLDMDRVPTWVRGKVALLGDAAHPFLPYQGQGGGVAIEDAVTLCALLPRGTSIDEVEDRLRLYEQIRDDRAHRIQDFTRWAGRDLDDHADARFDSKILFTSGTALSNLRQSRSSLSTILVMTRGTVLRKHWTIGSLYRLRKAAV
ncbi:3-hydroxybenzoate 6-hydroxylase 1 [Fusarium albosuccineum]|uniref:3-hydroxybenzoate 6-hydroxylase 1 n=1 Tax=Fusarium albosuccineum TaxID=1237068 RepID=A0A8H4L5X2_9HYPO|nr:3-hydroxybenzoate 6-hydroxylase 1 [Fusarium albosuccineum]